MVRKNHKQYIPEQGDIIWIDLDPVRGHEQGGKRPALVGSKTSYNRRTGNAVIFPITSKKKGYPFELEYNGEKIKGVVLTDQPKTIDWKDRGLSFIEKSKDVHMLTVEHLKHLISPE